MRTLLFVAAASATLLACGRSGLPPGDAFQAHYKALADGDTHRALALLEDAAESGHLDALATLAEARHRGYLRSPSESAATFIPIVTFPWQAPLAARRLDRALRAGVEAGNETARFFAAEHLLDKRFVDGEWVSSEADRDSARALYRSLADDGADPFRLAFLAQRLQDKDAYFHYLNAAAESGNPSACSLLFWPKTRSHKPDADALAERIDEVEACRQRVPEADRDQPSFDFAANTVRALVAAGTEMAPVVDSLRALGVFERHPRLAALVDAEA